jgi:hypothetical protein
MILESWFMVFVDVAPKESATRARGFTLKGTETLDRGHGQHVRRIGEGHTP